VTPRPLAAALLSAALLLAGPGCAPPPGASAVEPPLPGTGDGGGPPVAARRCAPPPGVSGSPQSIEEAVALINALPRPVDVPCLVESLDRPLRASATSSVSSAQPAVGERSPRLFLFSGPLVISVVPEGVGAHLVEFSVLGADGRSRKGELEFPVEADVRPEDPYAQVMFDARGTSCRLCHQEEKPDAPFGDTWSFSSRALRPVDSERVPMEAVRAEAQACDAAREPGRCALLRALFQGEVREQGFPRGLKTFFD
jgi:hypothetical protein